MIVCISYIQKESVVRNKNAGHGQGSTVTPISDEFVEYALNLAATNIVLLVGIYKRGRQK